MKTRKPLEFSGSEEMEQRRSLALEFYEAILAPDEEPAFVSDEATLPNAATSPTTHEERRSFLPLRMSMSVPPRKN
jgi:hypothetical protein